VPALVRTPASIARRLGDMLETAIIARMFSKRLALNEAHVEPFARERVRGLAATRRIACAEQDYITRLSRVIVDRSSM
jgi:hypothetical protein